MSKRHMICFFALVVLALWAARAHAIEPDEEDAGTGESADTAETPDTGEEPAERTYAGDESQARPLFDQAREVYDDRRYEEAARLLEQAFELHEHPLTVYNLGLCHRLAFNHTEAIAAYRQYLQICPRDQLNAEVYISIGECLLRLDRREEANEAFQHYLNLERDGELAGQAERAVETGETPTDQDRRDPRTVREARELCDRADSLWEQEELEQAALLFLRGYERMPGMHEFLYNAALCYMDAEMWADAARTFSRYVQTPGAEHDAWAFLGECHGEALYILRAVEAYERYLELEPRGTYADEAREFVNEIIPSDWEGSGSGRQPTRGEVERAIADFQTAEERYRAGRYREALESLQRAHELYPSRTLVFNMGRCYFRLNEWEPALTHFERTLERGDEGPYAVAHLEAAHCLLELNRPEEARDYIEEYTGRAGTDELPNEEENLRRARELRSRIEARSGDGAEHAPGAD